MKFKLLGFFSFLLVLSSCVSTYDGSYNDEEMAKLSEAAHIKPHPRQVAWQEMEMTAFFHFTVNTFTNKEWGNGKEDPEIFQPKALDVDQWVKTVKESGFKLAILTAKHHDGFCLWPSQFTDHDVESTSWREGTGDVVAEFIKACKKYDVKAGIYLSPWDRHEKSYGTDAYNDYFVNQLIEVIDNYGPIDEFWFDGANGEGPNGVRQIYDFDRYFSVIREKSPNAVMAIMGPDVRWVGNEHGLATETEWSVRPGSSFDQKDIEKKFEEFHFEGVEEQGNDSSITDKYKTAKGSDLFENRMKILQAGNLKWSPAECDVSIRPGWFYHAAENDFVKPLKNLLNIYYSSVGWNSVLLLNIPPDRRGLLHENDVARLKEFGDVIRSTFDQDLLKGITPSVSSEHISLGNGINAITDGDNKTWWASDEKDLNPVITFELDNPIIFDRILAAENIRNGQRVEKFIVEYFNGNKWEVAGKSTTIGYKKVLKTKKQIKTDKIRLTILSSRDYPEISQFSLYLSDVKDKK